jgi:hypothetical protein
VVGRESLKHFFILSIVQRITQSHVFDRFTTLRNSRIETHDSQFCIVFIILYLPHQFFFILLTCCLVKSKIIHIACEKRTSQLFSSKKKGKNKFKRVFLLCKQCLLYEGIPIHIFRMPPKITRSFAAAQLNNSFILQPPMRKNSKTLTPIIHHIGLDPSTRYLPSGCQKFKTRNAKYRFFRGSVRIEVLLVSNNQQQTPIFLRFVYSSFLCQQQISICFHFSCNGQ